MKLQPLEQLPELTKGKAVVLANGCFDILHVGHLRYLQEARALGDLLVVAINSDESMRLIKDPGRPILPEDERVALVSALRCVDYVVVFDEPDVSRVLEVLRPAIHAKGTDYTEQTVPERNLVLGYGGEVRITGDAKHHSTKDIIARILGSVLVLCLALLASCTTKTEPAPAANTDPFSDGAENVRLVGHHDLQGRTALVVTTKSDPMNGNWVYVGHHESFRDGKPLLNPITGKMEFNGTSILEISDPSHPKLVWHIPNETNRNSRGVSVVYDYRFDSSGRDYLIRNSELLTQGETGGDLKYQIFDISSRDTDPSKISLVSEIAGTPPNSCGSGCGGKFILRAHKGWWSEDSGYFYAASGEPGFRNVIVQIFDLKNPKQPKLVGRAWIPGLKEGEPGYEGQYSHHPVVDEENKRLYVGYRNAGGQAASFDISDPAHPKLVWEVDMNPPHRGPHTVSPIVYDTVPNFGKSALPRTYAFVVDEAGGAGDMKPCPNPVRTASYMLDITTESKPFPVSVWQVPVGNFCDKGGRFGPHQSAETVNGKINRFTDKLAWLAYFNAGIRVLDLSDPYNLKELGYYIPKTNGNSYPIDEGQPTVIQINDVDIDHRGLAYASDRAGTGLFILEYTGKK